MKIFLAGATGAIGSALVPQLTAAGHTAVGTTRSAAKAQRLRDLGAEPVVLDALDRDAVLAAVARAKPDAIIHELTALSHVNMLKPAKAFATTNRLRTEAVDHLLEAARANGVERVIAQSFTSWPYARVGGPVKSESDPLDPHPPKQLRAALEAIRHTERRVTEAGGVALRYGGFYGPGTGIAPGGGQWEMIQARKFPIVGGGGGIMSLIQVEDAARATVAALERWTPGEIYNVVDDDPAPVGEWAPALAQAVGAPPPRRVPRWVGRLLGEHVVVMMCEARGASNAKAKTMLDWEPRWKSWREGFPALAKGAAEGAVSRPGASAPRGASSPQGA